MARESGRRCKICNSAISTKVITSSIKSVDLGYLHGNQATCIEGNIKMTRDMAREKCIGQMAQSTKENGAEASSTAGVK